MIGHSVRHYRVARQYRAVPPGGYYPKGHSGLVREELDADRRLGADAAEITEGGHVDGPDPGRARAPVTDVASLVGACGEGDPRQDGDRRLGVGPNALDATTAPAPQSRRAAVRIRVASEAVFFIVDPDRRGSETFVGTGRRRRLGEEEEEHEELEHSPGTDE